MKHSPVRKERGRREESESEKYEHTLAVNLFCMNYVCIDAVILLSSLVPRYHLLTRSMVWHTKLDFLG